MHFIARQSNFPRNLHFLTKQNISKLTLLHTMANAQATAVTFCEYAARIKAIVPALTDALHKGQCGRIGVIGGSLEYTGAPYFAAISALRVGADLSHVFCQRDAATVIKSYSPELIVHPVLDADDAIDLIRPWLDRLHVLVIGPGLGRDPRIQRTTSTLIGVCREMAKPLVIDADGLAIITENPQLIRDYPNAILTPNRVEFERLFTSDPTKQAEKLKALGEGVAVLEKGAVDRLHVPSRCKVYLLPAGGSGRRCGGQGDLLCGSLATFLHWCLQAKCENPQLLAVLASSYLVKNCNAAAFQKLGRGTLASNMIDEIPAVFAKLYEQ